MTLLAFAVSFVYDIYVKTEKNKEKQQGKASEKCTGSNITQSLLFILLIIIILLLIQSARKHRHNAYIIAS